MFFKKSSIRDKDEKNFEKKNKKYCILTRENDMVGLFSFLNTMLGGIDLWMKQGYEVVIDDYNYQAYSELFQQPTYISLDDVKRSGDYLCSNEIVEFRPDDSMEILTNSKLIHYWHCAFEKYIHFQPEVKEYLDSMFIKFVGDKYSRTIGVLCRGTDYSNLHPMNHPKQPKAEELFPWIDELLNTTEYQFVFLATEDRGIFECFIRKYGKKLITIPTERIEPRCDEFLNMAVKRNGVSIYNRNLQYLTNIYVLSKCKSLVAGRTSGTVGAIVMADGFQKMFLWNEGRYGDELDTLMEGK